MLTLQLFLLVAGIVCWVVGALRTSRYNLVSAGLALFGIGYLIGYLPIG